MEKKVVKRITLGVLVYLGFAALVVVYYPDEPKQMDWEDRQEYNQVQIGRLELGMQRMQIINLMGTPDISEAKQSGEDNYQVLFYRTQHRQSDGITTPDECTPLLFKNDKLIAWGETAYKNYVAS